MTAGFLAMMSYLVSGAIGFCALRVFLKNSRCPGSLLLFLAPGAGLFISSFLLYFDLYFFHRISRELAIAAHLFLLVMLWGAYRNTKREPAAMKEGVVFFAILSAAALLLLAVMLKSPFGTGLDVWAIWKIKARFIYHAADWRAIFAPGLRFSHPDYPLFYPLALVWAWLFAGRETAAAAFLLAFMMTLCLVGLVMAAAARYGRRSAWVSGLFLISIPHFIGMGGSQYADIPVAYFFTAAIVSMDMALCGEDARWAMVSGAFAGMSGFVKNEGLLFFAAFCLSLALFTERRFLFAMAKGGLLFLAFTVFFKLSTFSPNHMLRPEAISRLTAEEILSRLGTVFSFFAAEIRKENSWAYAWPVFGVLAVFFRREIFGRDKIWIPLTVFFLNAGYAGVYCLTALNLPTQLAVSLDRLMIQSFPVLTYFFLTRAPFVRDA
ncbi:MAG: glycosyltransferase family 39 protein [Candidatus Omnitrophica bacterium]|nr:glycosyltransferase family 39 protein [Candidatus Omnitrophota bacterium]